MMNTVRALASDFDIEKIRGDFPILKQVVHGKRLVYLDSAATSQKPLVVIEALRHYYAEDNANIHRGVHFLSERATEEFEEAREKVRSFLNAREAREIVFVRGTTEAINLVAHGFRKIIRKGDEVIISHLEHHSNIVPWQILCEETGGHLRVIPVTDNGELVIEEYEKLLSERTRIVAVAHVSNALGTILPVQEIIQKAHRRGIPVLLDGAQAAPHLKVDVQELDCDFYAFSGHKMCGPTGIGVLYGRASLLEAMPPYQGGGDMIRTVRFEKTTYNDLPYKFEAGTPPIAGAVGLAAAIDYLEGTGLGRIERYEQGLLEYATREISRIQGVKIIGTATKKACVLSFVMEGIHPHDIGSVLDQEGIAIRTGHHCAMPLMERFGLPATARASIAFYNTQDDIDALVGGIRKVRQMFG